MGKAWESPKGGLWFSVILRPAMKPSRTGVLQLLAAVAIRQALTEETGCEIWLKWPNDIVLSSGKLGGILVETKTVGETLSFAILGIGLNVNQGPGTLPEGAVSLYSVTKRRFALGKLLRIIVEALETKYPSYADPSRLAREWWQGCVHRSKKIRIEGLTGDIEGQSLGVDEEGRLLVEKGPGRTIAVEEGTLRVLND